MPLPDNLVSLGAFLEHRKKAYTIEVYCSSGHHITPFTGQFICYAGVQLFETDKWPNQSPYPCWRCTCTFKGRPIPLVFSYDRLRDTFRIFGNFGSVGCALGYLHSHFRGSHAELMELWFFDMLRRYFQMDPLELKKVVPAPSHYFLKKFGGSLEEMDFHKIVKESTQLITLNPHFIPATFLLEQHRKASGHPPSSDGSLADFYNPLRNLKRPVPYQYISQIEKPKEKSPYAEFVQTQKNLSAQELAAAREFVRSVLNHPMEIEFDESIPNPSTRKKRGRPRRETVISPPSSSPEAKKSEISWRLLLDPVLPEPPPPVPKKTKCLNPVISWKDILNKNVT